MNIIGRDDKLLEFDSFVEWDANNGARVFLQDEIDELDIEVVDELCVNNELAQHDLDELLEENLGSQGVRPVDQPPEEDEPTEDGENLFAGRDLARLIVLNKRHGKHLKGFTA